MSLSSDSSLVMEWPKYPVSLHTLRAVPHRKKRGDTNFLSSLLLTIIPRMRYGDGGSIILLGYFSAAGLGMLVRVGG